MAKQIIDLGTSPNKGDGDPLRTAFDKVNDNFDELYLALGNPSGATTDVLPNTNGTINLGSADKAWADLHVADFIYLNGARIEVTAGGALLVNGGAPAEVQDTVGSVFGDDSTLLVDGVNSQIVGDYYGTLRNQNWMAAYDGFLTIANGGSTGPGPIQIVASANLDLSAGAGQVINANRNIVAAEGVTGDVTGNVSGNITGDVKGSVFGDDSTLLVDAVNSVIPKAVVEDSANWDTAYSWGDHSVAGYLTTFTETDPIVGAVNGIVKADGAGNITAAVAGTDYIVSETIDLATLKTEVAASVDFTDFQTRIAAL